MKKVRCPKCGEMTAFDETLYPKGRVLVFSCPHCQKSFRIRLMEQAKDETPVRATLTVVENVFHERQVIPLYVGENIIGRYVKGTHANASFRTVDPSVDTTHCMVTVKKDKQGKWHFVLRDAPSNTGTIYQNEMLGVNDRVEMEDDTIITIGATTLLVHISET